MSSTWAGGESDSCGAGTIQHQHQNTETGSMAEETLLEPLVADQEGFEWPFDNDLLKETLAALDAAEAGGGDGGEGTGSPPEHVEDEDVYKMKELIRYALPWLW